MLSFLKKVHHSEIPTYSINTKEEQKDNERFKQHKEYSLLGLMNIFHFLALSRDTSALELIQSYVNNTNLINQRDRYGRTPLQHAIKLQDSVNMETLELLLKYGADADLKCDSCVDFNMPTLVMAAL